MSNDQLLIDKFLANHPEAAMASIEALEMSEITVFIEHLPVEQATNILTRLPQHKAGRVLENMALESAIRVVAGLPFSRSETLLRIVRKPHRDNVLNGLPNEMAKFLRRSLSYDKDQAGAHLDPDVLTLSENMSLETAIMEIRRAIAKVKPQIFVLNAEKKLVGYIEANVLLSGLDKTVRAVMNAVPQTVFAEMNMNDVLDNWNDSFIILPVVNSEDKFLGVVSRAILSGLQTVERRVDNSAVKAGNALADLYLIGLTGLFGSADQPKN